MDYREIAAVLNELQIQQYQSSFEENALTDTLLREFHQDGKLVDYLKEVVPPLGHRLAILNKLNGAFDTQEQSNQSYPDPAQVNCSICNNSVGSTWNEIWEHLKYNHDRNQRLKNWTCPFCHANFVWFNAFQTHVKSQHLSTIKYSPQLNEMNSTSKLTPEDDDEQLELKSPVQIIDLLNKIRLDASKYMVKLVSTGKIAYSQCMWIVDSTKELITEIVNCLHEILSRENEDSDILMALNALRNPFSEVDTQRKLENFLDKLGFLIQPEEITLGSHFKTNHKNNQVSSSLVFDTMQYIPIRETLRRVLAMPTVMESVLSTMPDDDEGVFSNAMSGSYMRERFQKSKTPTIFLLFYYDELEVCNPLGSRAGVHQLGLCYFTILNIHAPYNSKLENIYLCSVIKSSLIKQYTINQFLFRPIQELKDLSVSGIDIISNAYNGSVKIELGQVTGDNLGIHKLLGYSESFVANYPCRFCRMPRQLCQTSCRRNTSLLRNRVNYVLDLQSGNLSETGIKNATVFNELPYFHITDNFCPDIMHDIFEGVAPLDIRILINKLTESGLISLPEINSRIDRFNYGNMKKDKPSSISLQNLRSTSTRMGQSAGQMYTLVLSFGLIFGDLFTEDSTVWKLYILLREILDVILSPTVTEKEIPYLESIIEDHHFLYKQLTGLSLIPKHHHLLHYPDAIRKIGPLLNYWVMRFEARHRFFKHVAHICCNFKNIAKSVTLRNQLYLGYKFLLNSYTSDEFMMDRPEPVHLSQTGYSQIISAAIGIGTTDFVIHTLNSVSSGKLKVKCSDVLLKCLCGSEHQPQFIKAILIFTYENTVFVLHKNYQTDFFDTHYHAFEVNLTDEIGVTKMKELHFNIPIHISKNYANEAEYINLSYRF